MAAMSGSGRDGPDPEILLEGGGPEVRDGREIPLLERIAHFWIMAGRSFLRNRCLVRASALTYTTLLALIPLLAVGLSVAKSFLNTDGGDRLVTTAIDSFIRNVVPQVNLLAADAGGSGPAAAAVVMDFDPDEDDDVGPVPLPPGRISTNSVVRATTNSPPLFHQADGTVPVGSGMDRRKVSSLISGYIQNIQSGALGMTGMVALIFVVISLLRTIESVFNDIWGVQRGRGWMASIEKYWTTVTLGPVLLFVALGLASGSRASGVKQFFEAMPFFRSLLFVFVPLLVIGIAFALFYKAMPNTQVDWSAALVGGAVGGCLWQLNNMFSFIYVSNVMSYSKIYGSLGIVPVFLLGLYLSWIIVLFGAQVAYAFQNRQSYLQARLIEGISQRDREFIAFRLITLIGIAFHRGDIPPTRSSLAAVLGVPTRLVGQTLQVLVSNHLLNEVGGLQTAYTPARPLPLITGHDVLQAMRAGKGQEVVTTEEPTRALVRGEFEKILAAEHRVASSTTLQSLVDEAQVHAARAIGPAAPATSPEIGKGPRTTAS